MTVISCLSFYKDIANPAPGTDGGALPVEDAAINSGVLAYDLQADAGILDVAFADAVWPAVVDTFLRDYSDSGVVACEVSNGGDPGRCPAPTRTSWIFRYTGSQTGPTANTVRFVREAR